MNTISELEPGTVAMATSYKQSRTEKSNGAVTAPVQSLSFARPDDDDFNGLPATERTAILTRLEICKRILSAGNFSAAVRAEASRPGQAGVPGMSEERLRKMAMAFRKSHGSWRGLWNKRNTPSPEDRCSLPFKFRQFVAALRTRYQREGGDAAAFRQLKRIWRFRTAEIDLQINGKQIKAGQVIPAIPGYNDWPAEDKHTEEPRGWSYDNLSDCCKPDQFTTAVLRIGRSAGAEFRPKVSTTREGLKYAQLYYFDDQQYDVHVNYEGVARKAMRPWGLDCLEALSACHVANLLKPNLYDDVEKVKQRIRQVDMIWFALHVLMTEGYRTDTGTILAGELGTANLPKVIADALKAATDGKVTFDGGGTEGAPPFAGMFEGKGGGNPRHKAPLESIRNLVRNEMSALPGATGLNRDASPETNVPDKGGTFKYNTTLLKALEALPEEQRKRLQFPFMDYHQFCQLALYFTSVIDKRDDHDLKHWHSCGFVLEAWRMDVGQPWRSMDDFLALPPDQRAILTALFESRPELKGVKRLSPWQVRQALRRDPAIKKLSPAVLPEILGLEGEHSRQVFVTKENQIVIRDREIDPEPMVFDACVRSRFDSDEWLPRGMEFFAFLDHISGRLHLFDKRDAKRGAFVGTCTINEDASLANRDALARACGKVAHIEAEFLSRAAKAGNEIARRNVEMRQNNVEVIQDAETGTTAAQRKTSKRSQRANDAYAHEALSNLTV
jgi:hypothetical protein